MAENVSRDTQNILYILHSINHTKVHYNAHHSSLRVSIVGKILLRLQLDICSYITRYNIVKKCIDKLLNPDQIGFVRGRNIDTNIYLVIDVILYNEIKDLAGAILLLDINKA